MASLKKRRTFSAEFKREAVRLIVEEKRSVASVARDLNIHDVLLHRWKRAYLDDQDHAFPGKGHQKPEDTELQRVQRQLKAAEEEIAILKKAIGFISKPPDKPSSL